MHEVGDHGEAFGEAFHLVHGGCIAPSCMRVPLVVVDPARGALGGTGSEGQMGMPSRHADVFATLLEWSGHVLRNRYYVCLAAAALLPEACRG